MTQTEQTFNSSTGKKFNLNLFKIPSTNTGCRAPQSITYFKKITPYLCISDARATTDLKLLKRHKVSTIINMVGSKWSNKHIDHFSHHSLEIKDKIEEDILDYLFDIIDIIEENRKQGKVTLIHCYRGISRAPTAILAYLIKYKQMHFDDAYSLLKEKVPRIDPNLGFLMKLRKLSTIN